MTSIKNYAYYSEMESDGWRKCSSCKKPIGFNERYYVCSVSTCNAQRAGYVFCSVPCFERHLPTARHKDAAAIESRSPSSLEPTRRIIGAATGASSGSSATASTSSNIRTNAPKEVLIIASRLKDYIQARGDMNTSASVMDVLSDYIRVIADRGIENARADGRKTVLDRDFHFLKK